MLCLGHHTVANEIDQELHALRPASELTGHLLELVLAVSRDDSPLLEHPVPKTAPKMALGQRIQVLGEAALLVLLDHEPQVKRFDVHGHQLGHVVCTLL